MEEHPHKLKDQWWFWNQLLRRSSRILHGQVQNDMLGWDNGVQVSWGPFAFVITTCTACFSVHFGGKGTVRYFTRSPALRTNSPSILEIKIFAFFESWATGHEASEYETYSEMCTKISRFSPSSGVMKPWPRSRQNLLHVPCSNGESAASLDLEN